MHKHSRFNSTLFYANFYLQTVSLKIQWVLNVNWRPKRFQSLSEAENTFSDEISNKVIWHFAGKCFQMTETDRRLPQQCQWNYTETDSAGQIERLKKNCQSVEKKKKKEIVVSTWSLYD